ncbi:MAG: SPOR domain-containing protein, partial [Candidatus Competibacter sp.]|nr:SPOR domain-containing protein [Candidatus Competibacter sp.]
QAEAARRAAQAEAARRAAQAEAARRKAQAEAARAKPLTTALPQIELVAKPRTPAAAPSPPAAAPTGGSVVVASFALQDNAYAVRDRYRSRNIRAAVEQTTANGRPLYLVRIWQ